MKTFTIDAENNITVFTSKKAAKETGAPAFASEVEFAELIGTDNKRLVEIFNSLPGVKPVTKFPNRKAATERIWKAIQSLGEAPAEVPQVTEPATSEPAPEAPKAISQEVVAEQDTALPPEVSEPAAQPEAVLETPPAASVDAPVADVAPAETAPKAKPTPAKKAPKAPKVAKTPKAESGPREGSKTAQVVAMLQREGGATLAEIMDKMAWQKHTVRGFMAGAMKKAGFTVESFKPEGGERTYRINS